MALYTYRAKRSLGKLETGKIEATSKQEAIAKIDSLGLFPVTVDQEQRPLARMGRASLKETVAFTHQLSTLINSGSTLLESLKTISSETKQVTLKPIITDVIDHVQEGGDFSEALKKYPRVFSELYVSLVKIGETSGTLGENLRRIAEFLERELDFRSNTTSIMIYPLLIISVGIITVGILLTFVIPKLVNIFDELGQTLPLVTTVLINASRGFSRYWFVYLGVVGLVFFGTRYYFKNRERRLKWDRFKLNIPFFGTVIKKIEVCQMARTLAILLKNGVTMDGSLQVLAESAPNSHFRNVIAQLEADIKEGSSLNEAMAHTKFFSPTFVNIVTVGENSGTLDRVLGEFSNDYDKEVNRDIKSLLAILEPLLILGVGLIIGFIVFSMLLPIFQIDFNF